jgi:hypothetical protein
MQVAPRIDGGVRNWGPSSTWAIPSTLGEVGHRQQGRVRRLLSDSVIHCIGK